MHKISYYFIFAMSIFLVGCSDDVSNKEPISSSNKAPTANTKNNSTNNPSANLPNKIIKNYEDEYGLFEVLYAKNNLGLIETYADFGLRVSSVEYGVFTVTDAYDYYPNLENSEGKIGYVKVHIAMELPATLDQAQFFFPNQTVLTIAKDIPPLASDNNFADEVAVNLGRVAVDEGYLFYLLAPNETEKLDEVKSFTLSTFAPFTSKNMSDLIEGYNFKIALD